MEERGNVSGGKQLDWRRATPTTGSAEATADFYSSVQSEIGSLFNGQHSEQTWQQFWTQIYRLDNAQHQF